METLGRPASGSIGPFHLPVCRTRARVKVQTTSPQGTRQSRSRPVRGAQYHLVSTKVYWQRQVVLRRRAGGAGGWASSSALLLAERHMDHDSAGCGCLYGESRVTAEGPADVRPARL